MQRIRSVLNAWTQAVRADRTAATAAGPRLPVEDLEFLPAALELIERPPSPIARIGVIAVGVLLVGAVALATLGQVDIVATARGRIVPEGQVKPVQSTDVGRVRDILVHEGDRVTAGQVLVRLDPQVATADRERLEADLESARHKAAVATLVLGRMGFPPPADPAAGPEPVTPLAAAEAEAQWNYYQARQSGFASEAARIRADLRANIAEIARVDATLPLMRERVEAQTRLTAEGYGRRLTLLSERQQLITLEQERKVRHEQTGGFLAQVDAVQDQRRALRESTIADVLKSYIEARRTAAGAGRELVKGELRQNLNSLRSPVTGFVQALRVTATGQVVQPAETVAVIVPTAAPLTVEAMVQNKDIGFISSGQDVAVKVDSFPANRFGSVRGRVERISEDAVEDEHLGLVFPIRVAIRSDLDSEHWKRRLVPGMSVTVDVHTGKRRLIEAVLAPLFRWRTEALRER